MSNLEKVLLSEINDFREFGHKFLNKEISKMEFKNISGGMGVYAEGDGKKFVIRFRIPSGVISINELKKIYEFAKKYNLKEIHFTTRQAIQFHNMTIDNVCDLMKEALENNIYTRGAGGNYPRNVSLSPLSGVDKNEIFDPTQYALAVGNYFLERIYTYNLPRKIKVSFSNSLEDTAHVSVQDLGFLPVIKDQKRYFKAYIGGGIGMNPKIALEVDELIEPKDVIYYVQGMIKLFTEEGDYRYRARGRIRYIRDKIGDDEFIKKFKEYGKTQRSIGGFDITNSSTDVNELKKKGIETPIKNHRLIEQKQKGLYSVYVHPFGGRLFIEDFNKLIKKLQELNNGTDIRLSMDEGLYIRNLNGKEAEEVLNLTNNIGGDTLLEESISCIGVPICQIGICNSEQLLNDILDYYKKQNRKSDALPQVFISGCHNSCGVHQIGKIGFCGKKKKVDNEVKKVFTLYIGGSCNINKVKLGEEKGDILPERVPVFLHELGRAVEKSGIGFDCYMNEKSYEFNLLLNKYLV